MTLHPCLEWSKTPPSIPLYDSAVMYGDGPFEMLRTFNRKIFKLEEHVERLMRSCDLLGIELPPDLDRTNTADNHETVLAAQIRSYSEVEEWRTVIQVGRGLLPLYRRIYPNIHTSRHDPWMLITAYPLSYVLAGKSHLYDGVDAVISDVLAIPDECFPQTIKHHNRIHFRLAEQRAGDKWPILLTSSGAVTEFPGANIVTVHDGRAYTPAWNCLPGISLAYANELAGDLIAHVRLTGWSLENCEEAFATCTPFSILPIRSIDGRQLECPGPVTRRLTEAWIDAVGCDFVSQARRWEEGTT